MWAVNGFCSVSIRKYNTVIELLKPYRVTRGVQRFRNVDRCKPALVSTVSNLRITSQFQMRAEHHKPFCTCNSKFDYNDIGKDGLLSLLFQAFILVLPWDEYSRVILNNFKSETSSWQPQQQHSWSVFTTFRSKCHSDKSIGWKSIALKHFHSFCILDEDMLLPSLWWYRTANYRTICDASPSDLLKLIKLLQANQSICNLLL